MFDPYQIMASIASKRIGNQIVGEKDYIDDNGILVCGICGEKRQHYSRIVVQYKNGSKLW